MVIVGTGDDLIIEYRNVQHVMKYNYLRVWVTVNGKDDKDILNKVAKEKQFTRQLHSALWNITKKTTRNIYKRSLKAASHMERRFV